ncbi:MAG TPA: carboxypeptidase-like regulatory domain-containing protein [Marmoricola sp.]
MDRNRSPRLRRWCTLLVLPLAFASVALGAADANASASGLVRGGIYGHGGTPSAKVLVFDHAWHYQRTVSARDGIYSITLAPGTYWLQAVDRRPAYDVKKYAPADVKVVVRAGHTTVHDIHMHRGAAIVGTLSRGHGKNGSRGAWSKLVAVSASGEAFWTKSNGKGQFAVGGLPAGSYSVYAYDRGHTWVARSTWVPKLTAGDIADRHIVLGHHGGRLLIDLYGGDQHITSRVTVTVVSRRTGQFWSAVSAANGTVTFPDLSPGRYSISVPGAGDYLARSGDVSYGDVRAGRAAFGSFRLTERGATVSGRVVDRDPKTLTTYPISGAQVVLKDAAGRVLATATTAKDGSFTAGGQLLSASGVRVIVNPAADGGGWMTGESYCRFVTADPVVVELVQGVDTGAGQIVLPRAAGQSNPQCAAR